MKIFVTATFFSLAMVFSAMSQIVFDSSHCPVPGTVMVLQQKLVGESSKPSVVSAAANQNWTFTFPAIGSYDSIMWSYKQPSDYAMSQYYPTANLLKEVSTFSIQTSPGGGTQIQADTVLHFYRRDNKRGLFLIGTRSVRSASTATDRTENLEIPFQISLQNPIHLDTSSTITYSMSNQDSLKKVFRNFYELKCIGSGTYTLNGMAYPALAIDKKLSERDTVYKYIPASGQWEFQSATGGVSNFARYFISPQTGEKIMIVGSGSPDGLDWTPTSLKNISFPTSSPELKIQDFLQVYPNPGEGICYAEGIPEGYRIRLCDAFGRALQTLEPVQGRVEISGLQAGIYFIQATDRYAKTSISRKLIMQ